MYIHVLYSGAEEDRRKKDLKKAILEGERKQGDRGVCIEMRKK